MKFRPLAFAFEIFQTLIVVAGAVHRAAPDGITKAEARAIGRSAVDEMVEDMEAAGVRFAREPEPEAGEPAPVVPDREEKQARLLARAFAAEPKLLAHLRRPKPRSPAGPTPIDTAAPQPPTGA